MTAFAKASLKSIAATTFALSDFRLRGFLRFKRWRMTDGNGRAKLRLHDT